MTLMRFIKDKKIIVINNNLSPSQLTELTSRITKDHIIINTNINSIYNTNINTTNLLYINIEDQRKISQTFLMNKKLRHVRIYDINGSRVINKQLYSFVTRSYNSLNFVPIILNIALIDILEYKPQSVYITGKYDINQKNTVFLDNICKNKNIQFDSTLCKQLNKPLPPPPKPNPPPPKPKPPPPKPKPPPPKPPSPPPPKPPPHLNLNHHHLNLNHHLRLHPNHHHRNHHRHRLNHHRLNHHRINTK